jgi:hypothetical protein
MRRSSTPRRIPRRRRLPRPLHGNALPGPEPLEARLLFASFVVGTLDDKIDPNDSVLSLREAIQQANSSPGDDQITFADAVRGTITLDHGPLAITDTSGTLALDGPGAEQLTISGNHASRVFDVGDHAAANITGLTIADGNADTGGGISTVRATLSLTNCIFHGNRAAGPTGNGGALYTRAGTVHIVGCTFSDNTAEQWGGGIDSFPPTYPDAATDLTVIGCSFQSNSATEGGAIRHYRSLTVRDCTFEANTASTYGGAIWGGGAITGTLFTANSGGAIWSYSSGEGTIADCTFLYNQGAISYVDCGTATIRNSIFRGNHGYAASFPLTNVTVDGCLFDSNDGGAFTTSDSRFHIARTTFVNNRVTWRGGGAVALSWSDGTLDNVSFIGNQGVGTGGAVSLGYEASLAIINSRFELNYVTGRDGSSGRNGELAEGGAIGIDLESISLRVTGTTFIGNSARGGNGGALGPGGNGGDGRGGAIAGPGSLDATISSCTFTNNRAVGGEGAGAGAGASAGRGGNASGGAIFGLRSERNHPVQVSNTVVTSNAAIAGNGGNALNGGHAGDGGDAFGGAFAAYPNPGAALISGCTLAANYALGGAGGFAAGGATRGNGGNAFGGGYYVPPRMPPNPDGLPGFDTTGPTFTGSTITGNWAVGGVGGAIGLGRGGGVYSAGQTVFIASSSRVVGNHASGDFDDVFPARPNRSPARRRALLALP